MLTPDYCYLYVLDILGTFVDVHVKTAEPIQSALSKEGGRITLIKVVADKLKKIHVLNYYTPCGKIKISCDISEEDYNYNLEFFGSDIVIYDSDIKLELEGNRFKL
jgi:hypothetical protein